MRGHSAGILHCTNAMTEIPYAERLVAALGLADLDGRTDAEHVRKGLIAAIRRAVQAHTVVYLGYADAGEQGVRCTGVLRVGARDSVGDLEGALSPFGADALRRPAPGTANRFVPFEGGGGLPRGVVATFFAGDEALGSIVVAMGDRASGRRLVPALDAAASRFAAALVRAADLDDALWLSGTAAAVIGADGTLGESTSPAVRHLMGRRGARRARRIHDAIRNGGPRRFACDGVWIGVEPLIGAGPAAAYLVTLSQAERPRLASDHALTPRQREVCGLYVQGWSPSRIAPRLGLTARSVQRLLKQSFERLGVSELSALRVLLSGPPTLLHKRSSARTRPALLGTSRHLLLERARRGLLQPVDWV